MDPHRAMERAVAIPQALHAAIVDKARRAQAPAPLDPAHREDLMAAIKQQLQQQDAVLVVHYYTDPDLQRLAEDTGGFVGDSLAMARFGDQHRASTIVVVGVRFMGETAKIVSPEKRVLMPTLYAECSLDLSCPADEFTLYCDEHPDRTVVVYANTSAAVKARADWVVTSSNAVAIVTHLMRQGNKLLWGPDYHLGHYVASQAQADMLLWRGSCVVHEEFDAQLLGALKLRYPSADVLVHPESPAEVIALATAVGSTTGLIEAAKASRAMTLIVATDRGIFYKMQQAVPGKELILAPTRRDGGGPCVACGHCPWMAMNGLENLHGALKSGASEIYVEESIRVRAERSLRRMLDFRGA